MEFNVTVGLEKKFYKSLKNNYTVRTVATEHNVNCAAQNYSDQRRPLALAGDGHELLRFTKWQCE